MIGHELYPFQRDAVGFALERATAAILAQQGCGKTHICLGVVERLAIEDSDFTGLLIVPLANIETTWAKLVRAKLSPLVTLCRSWEELQACEGPRLLLLHYEAISKKLAKKLVKRHWSLVGYDEAHRLKSRSTRASRVSARFANVDYRLILTGTPLEQAPQDLWAQFRFLNSEVLGSRWADFDERWLTPCGFMGYDRKFKFEKLPEFLALVEPYITRVTKAEVLNLPPLTEIRSTVPLLGQQGRVYSDMRRDMVTEVDGEEIVADMRITQMVREQQITGGFIRTEDGRSIPVGAAKARRLKSIVSREEWPVVVFVKYREELECVVAALSSMPGRTHDDAMHVRDNARRTPEATQGRMCVGVVSGSTRRTRVATIEAFQRGELDALVCQIRAGGVGLDLFAACVAIFYSTTFSYIDYDQAVARVHRHGQTRPVRIYLIQAAKTVDVDIYTALLMKLAVTQLVLNRRSTVSKNKPAAPAAKSAPVKTQAAAPPAAAPPAAEPKAPKAEKPKYGVTELAAALGVKPSSARVQLRNCEIEKTGKVYGWNSKAELGEVVSKIQANKKAPKAKAEETEDESEDEE